MPPPTPSTQALTWPIVDHHAVYHVGSLDPSLKGASHNRVSLEGNGLSVSLNPDAWREIARLGDEPLWELRVEKPARFVDALSLEDHHWSEVMRWAASSGHAQAAEVVRVSWHDEESNDRRYMEWNLADPDAWANAQLEAEELEDCSPEIERHAAWSATQAMDARIGFAVGTSMVRDMALTLYVEDVLHGAEAMHGVWWNERLDVQALSAPRGVLHTQALAQWAREQVADPDPELVNEPEINARRRFRP